jgi:hypothetical protein
MLMQVRIEGVRLCIRGINLIAGTGGTSPGYAGYQQKGAEKKQNRTEIIHGGILVDRWPAVAKLLS